MGRQRGVSVTDRVLDAWLWVSSQRGGFTKEQFAEAVGIGGARAHAILIRMYERQLIVPNEPIERGRSTLWLRATEIERGEATQ